MNDPKTAFAFPAVTTIPEANDFKQLNGRILQTQVLTINDLAFPDKGTFTKLISALESDTEVQISHGELRFYQKHQAKFKLVPRTVEVFIEKWNRQYLSLSASKTYGPVYRSILHVRADEYDFYIRIAGSKAARYLLDHPTGLTLLDPLHLTRVAYSPDEYQLAQNINALGYHKLVADTPLAFLDNDRPNNMTL